MAIGEGIPFLASCSMITYAVVLICDLDPVNAVLFPRPPVRVWAAMFPCYPTPRLLLGTHSSLSLPIPPPSTHKFNWIHRWEIQNRYCFPRTEIAFQVLPAHFVEAEQLTTNVIAHRTISGHILINQLLMWSFCVGHNSRSDALEAVPLTLPGVSRRREETQHCLEAKMVRLPGQV